MSNDDRTTELNAPRTSSASSTLCESPDLHRVRPASRRLASDAGLDCVPRPRARERGSRLLCRVRRAGVQRCPLRGWLAHATSRATGSAGSRADDGATARVRDEADARRWFEDEVRRGCGSQARELDVDALRVRRDVAAGHAATSSPERSRRSATGWLTRSTVRRRSARRPAAPGARDRRVAGGAPRAPALPGDVGAAAGARRRDRVGADRGEPGEEGGASNPQPKAREVRPLTAEELERSSARSARTPARHVRRGDGPAAVRVARARTARRRPAAAGALVEREHVDGVTKPYGKTAASSTACSADARGARGDRELPTRIDSPLLFPAVRGGYLNLRNWRAREWDTAIEAAGLAVCKCGHLSGGHDDALRGAALRLRGVRALGPLPRPVRPAAHVRLERARGRRRHVRARPGTWEPRSR